MPNRRALGGFKIFRVLLASGAGFSAPAQVPGAYAPDLGGTQNLNGEAAQFLGPDQLENLVAPVALYPDQLLSQVLAASTYPLEIVEAQQWLQQNGCLRGSQLVDAVKRQNWDPSVQALVIFPDTLALLNRDVRWITTLGNAFLAQQADVMDAIQRLRVRAQNNGRLRSTPQETVTVQPQGFENPIEIRPSDPRMMYVPSYNPQNVWGPPAQGGYPQAGDSSYGDSSGSSIGQFLGSAVNLASYFTGFGGAGGSGWGWALNWLTHSVLQNGSFLSMFGFHGGDSYSGGYSNDAGYSYGGGYGAPSVWVHNPGHRRGVPYSNREVAGRFGGGFGTRNVAFTPRTSFGGAARGNFGGGWRTPAGDRMGSQQSWRAPSSNRSFGNSYASNFGSAGKGYSLPRGYVHGNSGENHRSFAAPNSSWSARNAPALRATNQHFSASRSREHSSAPRASSQHFSAPHFSAPHFSRSHASGGRSSGGRGSKGHGPSGHSRKH